MKYMIFAAACTVLALTGCVDPKAQEAANVAKCTRYGVPPGSPNFADCMMRAAELDALEGQLQAQRMQAAGAALQGAAASMQRSQPAALSCTSVQTGTITNTTCN